MHSLTHSTPKKAREWAAWKNLVLYFDKSMGPNTVYMSLRTVYAIGFLVSWAGGWVASAPAFQQLPYMEVVTEVWKLQEFAE